MDTLPAQVIDGGYRGTIRLVPALPVGGDRKHLAWVAGALDDFDAFFAAIAAHGAIRYRWRGLVLQFFRSVDSTTPNAFAADWTVAYNVRGSIDTTAAAARETLFHEIFHLDDADHGDWSPAHLSAERDAIVRKCGARTACLAPYAPTATIVRRGTYYAFQPGNDVHEYAAEVSLRWYREQRAVIRGEAIPGPRFKCGPEENRRAWEAIANEFFGGVDLVPACGEATGRVVRLVPASRRRRGSSSAGGHHHPTHAGGGRAPPAAASGADQQRGRCIELRSYGADATMARTWSQRTMYANQTALTVSSATACAASSPGSAKIVLAR